VLDEVMDLFPGHYIHIGGDEAPKARWKECPDCQKRMKDLNIADEHALQGYFTNRILAYLQSKGRDGIGWNEILQAGLAKGTAVQYWVRGREALLEALRRGDHPVIMSTYLDAYLDHSYSLMPLSRAYRFEPLPKELDEKDASPVMGLEFPLWTEWVPNRGRMDYQVYPRLTAMAETGWTPKEKKDWKSFRRQLESFMQRLERLGIHPAPLKDVEPPFYKKIFGMFTIAQPQTKTAEK
jgi:hexosaminidase